MGTWPEARAARTERLRREHRHYTPDKLSHRRCPDCGLRLPVGINSHPTCGAGWTQLLELSQQPHPDRRRP